MYAYEFRLCDCDHDCLLTNLVQFPVTETGDKTANIQNSLARIVVKAPKSSHITPILRSLHWLKINERNLSLTYKVLTTSQPTQSYLCSVYR